MGKNKKRPLPQDLNLPLVGVESHAHLDMGEFREDLDQVFERAEAAGVATLCNVFLGSGPYRANRHLFDGRDNVFFLSGFHPNDCAEFDPAEMDAMRQDFKGDPRLKGVGETGLDYYWDRAPREKQLEAFHLHLDLARELDLPVVIHSREAAQDTVAALEDRGFKDCPVLWHCFGEGPDLARVLLANGWHLSIPGPVTYPKNETLRLAVAEIPMDRIMLETDCPYLSPQPYRGKRNEPAYMAFTCAVVAEVKGVEPASLWAACADNARRFFRL